MLKLSAIAVLVFSLLPAGHAAAFEPRGSRFVPVRSTPIERFSLFEGNRLGPLTFLGGLQLRGRTPFSSLSGLDRLGSDRFVAVTDRGDWAVMRIERDREGRMSSVETTMTPIAVDTEGRRDKRDFDAEGVRVLPDGTLAVSLEQRNRILRFDADGRRLGRMPHPIPENELRRNKGFEAVAVAPVDSPLRRAVVAVTEHSLDPNGDLFAAVLSGPRRGVFRVRRTDEFDVTDAAFLPSGDLILLERSYQGRLSLRMRLRRIPGDSIASGALVDGDILLTAGLASEIDNMEGLAIHRDERGTILTLVSDDNGSFLQRTLLLEFLLAPGGAAPAIPVPRMRPLAVAQGEGDRRE